MELELKQFVGLAGVPVITGLVQLTKPFVPDVRFWPVLSVVYGVTLNLMLALVMTGPSERFVTAGFVGVVAGLAAAGLFSLVSKGKEMMGGGANA